jgi:ACS family hexuronate transporter-like MFS transporter
MRVALAGGESGNFPAAIKTIAEWFPQKERALATGLFNCGTNIGQVIAPAGVMIAVVWGWRACFFILGILGFIGVLFWLLMYRPPELHPKVSPEELAYIQSDPPDKIESVPYVILLQQRQVWGIALSRLFSDGPWWLYMLWTTKFLVDKFHVSAGAVTLLLIIVYLTADFGAIIGGWISTDLIKKGRSVNYARKFALFCCACGVAPVILVGWLPNIPSVMGIPSAWIAVALIALAASSHQGWSSNMFTAVSDTLPKSAVAMTVGVASCFGAMGGALLQFIVGVALKDSDSYFIPFLFAGCTYFVAWIAFHLFLPKMEVAEIDLTRKPRVGAPAIWIGGAIILAIFFGMQYVMMKPEFKNQNEFLAKHSLKLKAVTYALGPIGKVGWREAKWIGWKLADGKTKLELVTFDRFNQPSLQNYSKEDIKSGTLFIQNKALRKGDRPNKYEGPTMAEVQAKIDESSWQSPPSVE